MELEQKEQIEIDFWKNSPYEKPGPFTEENLRNKLGDAVVFQSLLKKYFTLFQNAHVILETGAGQGWASCLVKKEFPNAKVMTSDISPWAIVSVKHWEDFYKIKLDNSFAAKSYALPVEDSSVDLIFCFSAAHHFVEYQKTLNEISRILKPGGKCLWLYEPASPKIFYSLLKRRMNKNRVVVPEDVLIPKEIIKLAISAHLKAEIDFYPSIEKRGRIEKLYFRFLRLFFFMNRFLPSTVNVIISK